VSTSIPTPAGGFRCEPITLHCDARGFVFEPVVSGELPAQRNVHVVLTEPGGIRGNHFHRRATEISVVAGPGLVRVRLAEGVRDFVVPAGEVWRFDFPPGVPHAFKNTGERAQFLVAFNTEAHDPAQPDVVREVLIES
jgi:UDP-2-acetamido-2,6-beta-L-arabino-hexul-4-ose reductase